MANLVEHPTTQHSIEIFSNLYHEQLRHEFNSTCEKLDRTLFKKTEKGFFNHSLVSKIHFILLKQTFSCCKLILVA